MPNLLLEIGTEELPLAALNVIYRELGERAGAMFSELGIDFKEASVEATPRRITLYIEGIATKQKDRVLEISGPLYEKAFDSDENPTPALQGFLKAKGANLSQVEAKETPRGKFVLVRKKESGKPTARILPDLIPELLSKLNFPKMMRWEASGFRFPRPIRWAVCFLDKKPISFSLADVKSSPTSFGHRFLAPKAFKLRSADKKQYDAALKKARVMLSLEKREEVIRKALKTRFKQIHPDEELVTLSAQLVEEPFFLEGAFDRSYLDLPSEVLASCMKKNQKIFACYGPKGKLMPKFVAVLNGRREGLARIRADYENVLDSRLKDARYFYQADTGKSLESKYASIDEITYLGKLGTVKDKAERMQKFSKDFAKMAGHQDLGEDLKRVSRLSKIDLMTQLVYEMPDLQGIMGREYALASGEKEEVARAIGTQYLPRNLSEKHEVLRKKMTPLGALFGALDRLDLLVGAFGTGIEPTGSQDPFALRRAAGILIKLIRAFDFPFSLREAIESCATLYGNVLEKKPTEKVTRFLYDRVVFELQLKAGSRELEIFQAVWNVSSDHLAGVFSRFEILKALCQKHPEPFRRAAKVVERTGNITKQASGGGSSIDKGLLKEPLEQTLYELIEHKSSEITALMKAGDYAKATLLFGETFYEPLDSFFKQIMVNAEDTAIRSNRQALMRQINSLYTSHLADLSVLSRIDD